MKSALAAFWVVFAVALMLGSGLAVVSVSGVTSPAAQASASPTSPLSNVNPSSLTNPSTVSSAMRTLAQDEGLSASLTQDLASLGTVHTAAVWSALLTHNRAALIADLSPDGLSCGTGGDLCITAVAEVALFACAVTAAPTLGLGCAVAGLVVLGVAIYETLFGQSAASQVAQQVANMAAFIVNEEDQILSANANGVINQINALNGTANALAYEAASAATLQLGNATFSEPLALAQSGVAGQLADILGTSEASIAQLLGQFLTTASEQLGSANTEAYSCTVTIGNSIATPTSAGTPMSNCPNTAPSTYGYQNGNVTMGTVFLTSGGSVFLNYSTPIILEDTGTVKLVPVDGATPWYNLTASHVWQFFNFSGPSTAYTETFSGSQEIVAPLAFPLTSNLVPTLGQSYEVFAVGSGTSWNSEALGNAYTVIGVNGLNCGPSTFPCNAGAGGVTAGENGAVTNLERYLFTLEQGAALQAETYWLVLRDLGYTSESQVPTRCLILSPAQIFSSGLTPTQLAAMNMTSYLRLYYAALANLAYTFNASSTITSFNVCGHHPTVPAGGGPVGFGVYGYGYLYQPNYTAPTPSYVVSEQNTTLAYTASSGSITSNVATGETLLVWYVGSAHASTATTLSAVVDSAGNSWGRFYQGYVSGLGDSEIWVANSTTHASTSDVVTATLSAGDMNGALQLYVLSASGIAAHSTSPLKLTLEGAGSGRTSFTLTNPTNAEDLLLGGEVSGNISSAFGTPYATSMTGGTTNGWLAADASGSLTAWLGWGTYTYVTGDLLAIQGAAPTTQTLGTPSTWLYSGVISFAPSLAPISVPLDTVWILGNANPTFAVTQPFYYNTSGANGPINTAGPTECMTNSASNTAANCDLALSPVNLLDGVLGNSTAGEGLTGSAYGTHMASGAGYAVYLTECFTGQQGANVDNITYVASTTGSCDFTHNTLSGSVLVQCTGGEWVFNLSSCASTPPVLILTTGCGGIFFSWLAGPIASGLSPYLGSSLACDIGLIVTLIVYVVIVGVIAYVAVRALRRNR